MTKETKPKQIIFYQDNGGKEPFSEWLNKLRDAQIKRRILIRLRRFEQGNYGDYKSLGENLNELRLFFGAGYRIYFGEDAENIVIILCAGDKSTQAQDIKIAQKYWKEYLQNDKI